MKKNYLKILIAFCFLFVFGTLNIQVNAAEKLSYTVDRDLITFSQISSSGHKFRISTTNNYNGATDIEDIGGISGWKSGTTAYGYVSRPNGVYYGFSRTTYGTYPASKIEITNSCDNEYPTNKTGEFTVEKCYIKAKGYEDPILDDVGIAKCADGYVENQSKRDVITNTCPSTSLTVNGINLNYRYCKVVLKLSCEKKGSGSTQPVAAPSIKSMSLSSGKISFKSGTKKYSVTVASNVSSLKISATAASGSSFVKNYGPRTVKLNYGSNKVQLKVKNSAGTVVTYTLTVKRTDDRSTVNTLSNLTVDVGTLNPAFSSSNNNYTVNVSNEVTSITVNATLTDNKSSFANGFGPRTVNLQPGPNKVYVKVTNQKGATNVYNITINRATEPSVCTTQTESLALLKEIKLSADIPDVVVEQIEGFDPLNLTYDDVKVPFDVYNLVVNAYTQDEGDTVKIEGTENLEENVNREVKITVTSKKCPNYSNTYTLNVTRQSEVVLGSDATLKSVTIKGHDEFEFQPNKLDYKLKLKNGETKLDLTYEKADEKANCVVEGNEELEYGDTVVIRCTSEDESDSQDYTISIDGVEKAKNGFLVVILVIIIVLILVYLVLRLLGYRIYFNFSVLGAFFRGLGEKAKNTFDK